MKYRLMDILACPMCKHFPLELYVLTRSSYPERKMPGAPPLCELYCSYLGVDLRGAEGKPPCEECIKWEVDEGALYCRSCERWYPIIDSVPHMLPDHLREREKSIELSFLERNKDRLPEKIVFRGKPHNLQTG